MRRAQRSVRAHRQHPQRPTRRIIARHRSADLPEQADGSHKPRATTQRQHRITGERQRATPSHSECSEISDRSTTPAAKAAPPPPSEHTHLESPCPRSRRTKQAQFPSSTPHEPRVISSGRPATASGVAIIYVHLSLRTCRRHPGRLNARLRTAATTSGVAEMSAFGHRLRPGGGRTLCQSDSAVHIASLRAKSVLSVKSVFRIAARCTSRFWVPPSVAPPPSAAVFCGKIWGVWENICRDE